MAPGSSALPFGSSTPPAKPQVVSERPTERSGEPGGPGIAWHPGRAGNNYFQCGKRWEEGTCGLDGRTRAAPSCADLSRRRAIASPAGKPSPSREQRGEGEPRGRCIYSSSLLYHPAGMQALGGQPAAERGWAVHGRPARAIRGGCGMSRNSERPHWPCSSAYSEGV